MNQYLLIGIPKKNSNILFLLNQTVTVNGALKIKTLEAGNGIIHVINKVLIPEPESNIMQVLERKGNFSTLLTALAITGLTPTVQNGQYNVIVISGFVILWPSLKVTSEGVFYTFLLKFYIVSKKEKVR